MLSLAKGLDPATGERLSTLVQGRPVAVLSGPNIADGMARDFLPPRVIASDDEHLASTCRPRSSLTFRVYVNDDVIGVEPRAAAKNVIGLAAGGADGLPALGDNAKAALVARGLAEMARLAVAAGGKEETFSGLAGMGDLVVTCWSPVGRNRRAS